VNETIPTDIPYDIIDDDIYAEFTTPKHSVKTPKMFVSTPKTPKTPPTIKTPNTPKTPKTPMIKRTPKKVKRTPKALDKSPKMFVSTSKLSSHHTPKSPKNKSLKTRSRSVDSPIFSESIPTIGSVELPNMSKSESDNLTEGELENYTLVPKNNYRNMDMFTRIKYTNSSGKFMNGGFIVNIKKNIDNQTVWSIAPSMHMARSYDVRPHTMQKLWRRMDISQDYKELDIRVSDIEEFMTIKFEKEFTEFKKIKEKLRKLNQF